jgi:hypothetical protein
LGHWHEEISMRPIKAFRSKARKYSEKIFNRNHWLDDLESLVEVNYVLLYYSQISHISRLTVPLHNPTQRMTLKSDLIVSIFKLGYWYWQHAVDINDSTGFLNGFYTSNLLPRCRLELGPGQADGSTNTCGFCDVSQIKSLCEAIQNV